MEFPNKNFPYPKQLNPKAVAFLRQAPKNDIENKSIPEIRKEMIGIGDYLFGKCLQGVNSENNNVDGRIPIRIYSSGSPVHPDKAHPAIVYAHGGAWCFGGLDMADEICSALAKKLDAVVVSVDYRLAPEHPYPAGLDDVYRVLEWVSENADHLKIDKSKIIVGGGSAGGNIAAAVALKAANEKGPRIFSQLLIYPACDLSACNTHSYLNYGNHFGLQKEMMEKAIEAYVPIEQERKNPLVSPLLAEDVNILPPALILTAGFDPLHDEGIAYADKLKQSGVNVVLLNYEKEIHGFVQFSLVFPDSANKAIDDICRVLNDWLIPI